MGSRATGAGRASEGVTAKLLAKRLRSLRPGSHSAEGGSDSQARVVPWPPRASQPLVQHAHDAKRGPRAH